MCNQPAVSINAATSTGEGSAIDLGHSFARHTAVVWTTGSPTAVTVALEFSHDGTHWATSNNAGGSADVPFSVHTERVARYVRANLTTLSGGSSPTVTVTIASA